MIHRLLLLTLVGLVHSAALAPPQSNLTPKLSSPSLSVGIIVVGHFMKLPLALLTVLLSAPLTVSHAAHAADDAITTPRIESFPREGKGYALIDWHQRAEDFLAFTLDPVRKGDYLPLMWWDDSKVHWKQTTFGLPSYVGMKHQWGVFRNAHEGIVTMGTLISGALLGHDMTRYSVPGGAHPVNLVRMQEAYFLPEDGVFLDGIGSHSDGSFW